MSEKKNPLHITSKQLTMMYFMAGLSITKIPKIWKEEFEELMKQMAELSRMSWK